MFRAALARPALSGAAALAVVSASTATVAVFTGHAGAVHVSAAAATATPATVVNAAFAERPADPTLAAEADQIEREQVQTVVLRQIAADRIGLAERSARSAQRRALLSADPRVVARAMLGRFGWSATQFGCLDRLWMRESKWSLTATNPSSGAYGIPQALPGTKMASAGADWRHNPLTQIRWGLGYIQGRYGSPCTAWSHSQSSGWY